MSRVRRSPGARPDSKVHPPELDGLGRFLSTNGTTLLIKGYAGAGKTTLALQLLRALAPRGNGVYISSRVSEAKLSRQLPGLADPPRGDRSIEFRDVRLGTGSLVLGEVLKLMRDKRRTAALVLDTWDGLAKEMDDKERLKAEKTLISIADSTETRMIFVSEEPGMTTMDYLVDGIVELTRSEQHDRVFREVELQKLRGTLIAQHKYLYTLLNGRFAEAVGYKAPDLKTLRRTRPIPDRATEFGSVASFGSKEVDEALGGIRRGSVFTLEYTEQVPHSAIRALELGAAVNWLNHGRSVALTPLPGVSEVEVEAILRPVVDGDVWGRRLSITQLNPELTRTILGIEESRRQAQAASAGSSPAPTIEEMLKSIEKLRNNSSDGSLLYVSSLSLAETASAQHTGRLLEMLAQFVMNISRRGSKDALLLLLQSNSQIRSGILALSERHARMFVKDRSIVLLGEKPSTEAFVLEHDAGNPLIPRLTMIV